MTTVNRNQRGFSLLEVLIAVVLLATGLLALAALQGSLARNSADAKARNRVAVLVSNEMDRLRNSGYASIVDVGNDGVADATANTCTATTDPCVAIKNAATEAALGSLSLSSDVKTYRKKTGTTEFEAGAAVGANTPEFKTVTLTGTWTDTNGKTHTLSQRTAISALSLEANNPIVNNSSNGNFQQSPVVREDNPYEAGMIPIAIGNGSDTAATNPKPIVAGRDSSLIETKYNILTYQDEGSSVRVQQRIETTNVACRCKYGNQAQITGIFTQNYRPTYWDGTRYVAPERLKSDRPAVAGPIVPGNNEDPQSDLCTDCCRDHADASTDTVKFDPWRTSHDHYERGNLVTAVLPGSNGEYSEVCRMIRVDGFWHTAQDLQVAHVGYVATGPAFTDKTPDPTYANYYETFVIDWMKDLFVGPTDGQTVAQRYTAHKLDDSALDLAPNSDTNNKISIDALPTSIRYLHSHAVLIDHIEPDAQKAIDAALAACKKPAADKVQCVLPLVPFTTINVTEMSNFNKTPVDIIDVLNIDFEDNDDGTNVDGKVWGLSSATPNSEADATLSFRKSNSALADFEPIDPDDATIWKPTAAETVSDRQTYVIPNGTPDTGGTGKFSVYLSLSSVKMTDGSTTGDPYAAFTDPFLSSTPPTLIPCAAVTDNKHNGGAIDSACAPTSKKLSSTAVNVTLGNFNYDKADKSTKIFTCPNAAPDNTVGTTTGGPICRRYTVTSVAVTPTVQTCGVVMSTGAYKSQTALIQCPNLNDNDKITIGFSAPINEEPKAVVSCSYSRQNDNKPWEVNDTATVWTSGCD